MEYKKVLELKNGNILTLKNGTAAEAKETLDAFVKAVGETDNLRIYPDENNYTEENEASMLERKTLSKNQIEIVAIVNNKVVGFAGIDPVANLDKLKHRATFGIAILKDFWGQGIGNALTEACIECAKDAGFSQIELDVVADNLGAIHLYKKFGFVEFGRNPKGFKLRSGEYKELVYMLLEL